MKSFRKQYIESIPVTQNILQTVRLIGELKGKQELFKQQSPQLIEVLRQTAVIQSIESSNRIEGISAPLERIKALAAEKTTPANRSEQEIAGYRNVLNTIHSSHPHIPVSPNVLLQFHRDIYALSGGQGGRWKTGENEIAEIHPDGSRTIRFRPVSVFETPGAVQSLCDRFSEEIHSGKLEPLLLIPAFILDFLCIHPFSDGNGRISRLLTLLLLYQSGYEVGRFISLEKLVEDHKEGYYNALHSSSQHWHEGTHNILPWNEYFLGILLKAYREFQSRAGLISSARGGKTATVLETVRNFAGQFTVQDIQKSCPTVGLDMIRKILRYESQQGRLVCLGKGRDAKWQRI